jgi:hypothetical protein
MRLHVASGCEEIVRRILILGVLLATACSSIIGERGSGDFTTEERDVAGFTAIVLEGEGSVTVEMGDTETLTIEAEDNLLPLLTSEVSDGRLILGTTREVAPTRVIRYTVTAETLDSIEISGSGTVTIDGLSTSSLDTDISGSGAMNLTALELDAFTASISGSGKIEAAGSTGQLDIEISGSGAFEGEGLEATTGEVSIPGSGAAVVNVTDDLTADVSGSGSISYLGNPVVESNVSGSGSIRPR